MKKIFIIILIVLPVSLLAQRFEGGLVLGGNVSQIEGDNDAGYKKLGFVGGAFVATEFEDKWGGQLEIRYAGKGSRVDTRIDTNTVQSRKIRLQYIELPILATYDLNKNFQFQGGIAIGYLFSAAQDDGPGYEEFEGINPSEISGCLGVSYKYSNRLYFNVRGSYSILPTKAYYPGAIPPYGMYNNVITFAGYFWFGRSYY